MSYFKSSRPIVFLRKGVLKIWAWCKCGTRTPRPGTSRLWDPRPGTPLKCKCGTLGSTSKFKRGTPGSPTKFKSGTFIITFLHCYIYIFCSELIHHFRELLVCLIWLQMERAIQLASHQLAQ